MVETRTDLEVIETDKAAKPIGPYSQAIRANGMIYVAGEKEYLETQRRTEQGIPVNPNLRQELQTMRDELKIAGYEAYF